jgi:hypothetical protein
LIAEGVLRNLNRRNCPQDRLLVSVSLATDEISVTDGRRLLVQPSFSTASGTFSPIPKYQPFHKKRRRPHCDPHLAKDGVIEILLHDNQHRNI